MDQVAPTDHIAGTLNSDGSFSGYLKQVGCRNQHNIRFSGQIGDETICAEFFTSAHGNPPELAAKALHCQLPIMSNGCFGSTDSEESRFWLRYRPSGGSKYQWLSGQVLGNSLYVKLTFGSPKFSSSYCYAEGVFIKCSGV